MQMQTIAIIIIIIRVFNMLHPLSEIPYLTRFLNGTLWGFQILAQNLLYELIFSH